MRIMAILGAVLYGLAAQAHAADPILLSFTATWCPYCQVLKPTIENFKRAGYDVRIIEHTSPDIHGTGKSGEQMAESYGVTKLPALLLLSVDPNGKQRIMRLPTKEPDKLLGLMEAAGMQRKKPAP